MAIVKIVAVNENRGLPSLASRNLYVTQHRGYRSPNDARQAQEAIACGLTINWAAW